MTFDFDKLSDKGAISGITDAALLFDALPNKAPGYGYLRAVQKTVLDVWSSRRQERDLVLKTNTGGGKTIVGLLILQTSVNEGLAPALYVAPDQHLADRVVAEAVNLGLAATIDPQDGDFLSGRAIGVTTMQVFFNGKSRFGLTTSTYRQPVPVRAVVVDDAHAALAVAEEQTRIRIPRDHPAWTELVDLFEDELKGQSATALLDIMDGEHSAALRIPFWAWRDRADRVLPLLRAHRTHEVFEWGWPLIGDLLHLCSAVVTADAVEIVPPCPPIEKLRSFADAQRRVYLTATLADDSVLITHFDANPTSVAHAVVPDSAADLGDRLVLSPQSLNPGISHGEIRALAAAISAKRNVVVLVPSHRQAALWDDVAQATVSRLADISRTVSELNDRHLGLAVIVNRYDGIDLPDDACRLLIIDGLPEAYSGHERREALALRDTEAMVTRQLQRIEQGMGRGVRSRDDRCAVLLLGPGLVRLVVRADVAGRLSPATRAQLDLSHKVAADLKGVQAAELQGILEQVIDGDPAFRKISREALVGITYGTSVLSPTAAPMRAAYNAAVTGQHQAAASKAQEAVNIALNAGDTRLAGWLGEALADYTHALDTTSAQAILTTAVQRNSAVLRPAAGLAYTRVSLSAEQAQQASAYLSARYEDGTQLVLGIKEILADLAWDAHRTNATEQALADLGEHLGFTTQRPERDFGNGGDVLWVVGDKRYLAIEAKTGVTGGRPIWKKEIDQLAGFVNWCINQYGTSAQVTPVMMHPSAVVERTGTPPPGARAITLDKAEALKQAILAYGSGIAMNDTYRDPERLAVPLQQHKLTAAQFGSSYTWAIRRE